MNARISVTRTISAPSVHDSQKFEDVLDASNTASDVWADSAYRSAEIEEKLAECGLKSRIHRRAYRNRKLSEAQKAANTTRSKVRARVEHVFGDQKNGMGAKFVRTTGRSRIPTDISTVCHDGSLGALILLK